MVRNPWRRLLPALLSSLLLAGCATYSSSVGNQLEQQLAAGNPAAALATLEQRDPPERDRVLFLLDKAMLQRLMGDYATSNQTFESAKTLMDQLTAASASETAGSFLINDATRSYTGEPFEQALLHAYAALNYLDLRQLDEARVEALQVEERLKEAAGDGPLSQDPFARYLAGMIYEAQSETSDALISYRDALATYDAHAELYGAVVPEALKRDLLRLTARQGIRDEHKELVARFGDLQYPSRKEYAQNGELVFLLHSGLAPIKREHMAVIYPPVSEFVVTVALPSYQLRTNPVERARLALGPAAGETERVEDVSAIAKATLDHEMGAITARAVVRAVAKYKLAQEAKKKGSAGAGLLTNLANLLTERADTRSWLTLPGEVQMARILVPPGDYKLRVEMVGGAGGVLGTREFDVHMEKGKMTFVSCHWVPAMATGRN